MSELVVWTARLCVACYLLRYLAAARRRSATPGVAERLWWTAGCLLLWVHVGVAFHAVHHWSHAAAVRHTAEQTAAVIGLNWGGGVWFNYAAMLLWGVDAVRLWGRRKAPRWWSLPASGFLALMMISATVVFGPPYWWGVAAAFAVLAVLLRR